MWRGSLRIAGSDFFRRYLVNNISILETVDRDVVGRFQKAMSEAEGGSPDRLLGQLVDLLIAKQSFASEFETQYQFHVTDPVWRGLRDCAATRLADDARYRLVIACWCARDKVPSRIADISSPGGRGRP